MVAIQFKCTYNRYRKLTVWHTTPTPMGGTPIEPDDPTGNKLTTSPLATSSGWPNLSAGLLLERTYYLVPHSSAPDPNQYPRGRNPGPVKDN